MDHQSVLLYYHKNCMYLISRGIYFFICLVADQDGAAFFFGFHKPITPVQISAFADGGRIFHSDRVQQHLFRVFSFSLIHTMSSGLPSIDRLNQETPENFVGAVHTLFETAPSLAERLLASVPQSNPGSTRKSTGQVRP